MLSEDIISLPDLSIYLSVYISIYLSVYLHAPLEVQVPDSVSRGESPHGSNV